MMKNLTLLGLLVAFSTCCSAQFSIPDSAFAARLQVIVPNAMNGNILDTNHTDVLTQTAISVPSAGITDLSGLRFFTSLEDFSCHGNPITALPSLPSGLEVLDCSSTLLTALPLLPGSLLSLNCGANILTLPVLPSGLELLYYTNCQLTALPVLPNSLKELHCGNNELTTLPTLPNSLEKLFCFSNALTTLPPIPSSLKWLFCDGNLLSTLPVLPNSIERISCDENGITVIPALPSSLQNFSCSFNQLTSLPSLPNTLQELHCYSNQISALPALPNSLEVLSCGANQISCLPKLPASLTLVYSTGNSISCIPNIVPGLILDSALIGFTPVLCSSTGPCVLTETITGRVYCDANGNGSFDTGEVPVFSSTVEAQPGNHLSGVDINGNYALVSLDPGIVTVQGQGIPYHTISTPIHNVTITPGHIDSLNHVGYYPIPGYYDLVVDIYTQPARPGFDSYVYIQVQNIGTETTTANIDMNIDADQSWVGASVVPNNQAGNTANWSVIMAPWDTWNAVVTVNTAANVPLGTLLVHWLIALPNAADETPADNSINSYDEVVGSYDPNAKSASPASMDLTQLMDGEAIEYTIRFQNTGTFMAQFVQITDTLSSDLLWGTFEYISSSHMNYWTMVDGVLVFQFDDIQLPDSTSDEPNSHGFVKFRIKPDQSLSLGDIVLNTANIFFDFNEPVITDLSVFTIEVINGIGTSSLNSLQIYPNPTSGLLSLQSETEMRHVNIYQLDGRLLRSDRAAGMQHQLDIAGLNEGMYLLEVETSEGRITSRVLKN